MLFYAVDKQMFWKWCQINVRENRWGNQEWTIQNIGNIGHTRNTGRKQTKQNDSTQNNSPKTLKWHWTDEWPYTHMQKTLYVGKHVCQFMGNMICLS